MKNFSNEDLKAGMLVELYNGDKGILIPIRSKLEVFNEAIHALSPAYLLEDSFTNDKDRAYGIIKVYGLSRNYSLFETKFRDLLWKYKKPVK